MSNQLEKLTQLARLFRNAILKCPENDLPATLRNFPHGACGDTSRMLGKFLSVNGIRDLKYICKHREDWSHAWLETGGVIIDITSDQFDDSDIQINVIEKNKSQWHRQFKLRDKHDCHPILDIDKEPDLHFYYKKIITHVLYPV